MECYNCNGLGTLEQESCRLCRGTGIEPELKSMTDQLTASEALFGFMGWLTTREEDVTFGSSHNAAIAADLVAEFCMVNDLSEPKDHWADNFIMPTRRIL